MKLGAFGTLSEYEKMAEAGYDFAELDIPEIAALTEEDFESFKEKVLRTGLRVLTGSRLFPVTDRTFMTSHFRPSEYRSYLEHACNRSAGLGIKKIIMGNGKARAIESSQDLEREEIFVGFLKMISEIAGENGMDFILEPLGPKYSNYLNTLPEAAAVIEKVNMPNAYIMADLRHMVWNGEDFSDLIICQKYLKHIHMDYPLSWPARPYISPDDGYNYKGFIGKLLQTQYNDTVTIEADLPLDWKKAHQQAVDVLEDILNR